LWNITTETLRKIVPAEKFAPTEVKMNAFGSGYGPFGKPTASPKEKQFLPIEERVKVFK